MAALGAAGPCHAATPPRAAWEARRLTPEGHDAIRPSYSSDALRIAYVHLPAGSAGQAPVPGPHDLSSSPRLSSARRQGGEIWEIDLRDGTRRRRIGMEDLIRAGLDAPLYDLLDIAWSGGDGRLAFTWFDGRSWGQVALSGPGKEVALLPAPSLQDPWEGGAGILLSSAQFLWSADGRSGTLVGWDGGCGKLFRSSVPPEGAPHSLALPRGCSDFFLPVPGFWLHAGFDEEFARRLAIIDESGRPVDSMTFPQGASLSVRWGPADERGRPAVVGWSLDADQGTRSLFVWRTGSLVEWRREPCTEPCADAVAMTRDGRVAFLEGDPGAARLMILDAPAAPPGEILPAGVEEIAGAPDGRSLLAVRAEGGMRSLWLLTPRRGEGSGAGAAGGVD